MDVDEVPDSPPVEESPPPPYRPKGRTAPRRAFKSTFKGFDVGSDDDDDDGEELAISQPPLSAAAEESQGMFMTQPDEVPSQAQQQQSSAPAATRSQRKRPAPLPDRDIMEEIAPTAARIKRMRLEGREDAIPTVKEVPPSPPPPTEPEPVVKKGKAVAKTAKGRGKGKKKNADDSEDELLEQFIMAGQQEEAKRQEENELLRRQLLEGDIDLGEIRKATAVHQIQIRRREAPVEQSGEQDRWNPRWNGLRNFKKFRKQTDQDAASVRAQPKRIVSVKPTGPKEYGRKDDYWLGKSGKYGGAKNRIDTQAQTEAESATRGSSQERPGPRDRGAAVTELSSDSSSLPAVADFDATEPSRSRKGKASARTSQREGTQTQTQVQIQTQTQMRASTQGKRAAPNPPTQEKPTKRRATRATRATRAAVPDSDEDEDSEGGGLTFRFGARK